jgi:hypothetical protein
MDLERQSAAHFLAYQRSFSQSARIGVPIRSKRIT